ncbi:hypothetical protein [Microbulbifer epialgicus]|uniref:Uncharacterized protein n=1 Tax=Microbulbifer epialgicus TaxID=393907 RepID=A0ABV4NUG6_9GAMM
MAATNNAVLTKNEEIYQHAPSSERNMPWLHGVEYMTADSAGYVYWKGLHIEHCDSPYESSSAKEIQDLAKRCLHLESLGIRPGTETAIWHWNWMKDLTSDHPWLGFFKHAPRLWESDGSLAIVMAENRLAIFTSGNIEFFKSIGTFLESKGYECDPEEVDCDKLRMAGFDTPKEGQKELLDIVDVPLARVVSLLEKYHVPRDLYQIDGRSVPDFTLDEFEDLVEAVGNIEQLEFESLTSGPEVTSKQHSLVKRAQEAGYVRNQFSPCHSSLTKKGKKAWSRLLEEASREYLKVNEYKIRYNRLWGSWVLHHKEVGVCGEYHKRSKAVEVAQKG